MLKALIVDDHSVVRQGLRTILAQEFGQLTFAEAKNSQEAVDLLIQQKWNLVLLDISLPGRSGLDVLEDSKRLHPRTPVLVFSFYPEEDFAIRSFQMGASAYLNKQCSNEELIVAVKKVLGGGRYVTESLAQRLATNLGGQETCNCHPHEALSNRELQVLRMVAMGKTVKKISAELSLSEKTVGTYRSRISEKMGLSTGIQLTRYAFHHNLVQ